MLSGNEIEVGGVVLGGIGNPIRVRAVSIDPGAGRVTDALNPVGDDLRFGRDYSDPPLWQLALRIHHREPNDALAVLSSVAHVWKAPRAPGDDIVLRYARAGRVRRVYGRPRAWVPDVSRTTYVGWVDAAAAFQTSDSLHYGDAEESVTVGLIPGDAGGLLSPLVSPLTTVAGGQRQGLLEVGGDAPAPLRVTFRGPVLNPLASSTGWEIGLNGSLAYDQSVTVDTRRGTVVRNDGVSMAGALTRRTYLPEARLRPGAREIIYRGTDITGTSSCTVAYRPAFYGF